MRTRSSQIRLGLTVAALSLLPLSAGFAADSASPSGATAVSAPPLVAQIQTPALAPTAPALETTTAAAKYPYGVEDVIKLSRAQVSEDVIVTYIQNSGTMYGLGPKEIVALKEAGVSDRVLNTMLDQRKRLNETANQVPAASVAQAQPIQPGLDNGYAGAAPAYADSAPVYAPPAAAEAESVPSSVYVIPFPYAGPRYSYFGWGLYGGSYYCAPAYRSYYRFGGPVRSFHTGFAGHGHARSGGFRHR